RPLPAVPPGERVLLLILWNTLRERNEPDAGICHWMSRVAAVTKIDRLARRLLRRRSVRKKLLGLVTLGQLRDRLEWPRLCQLAQSGHPLLSLAATQAIARNGCLDWASWHKRGHRSEEHTSELQSQSNLVCRLLLEKKK